jgi:MobC-like protein
MSRPKIDDQDKRVIQVNIRLTVDENAKVVQFAAASGISPANWIRKKVFSGKMPPVKLSPADTSLYQELRKIGVNLNQATHKLNAGDFPQDFRLILQTLLFLLNKILKSILHDREHDQG